MNPKIVLDKRKMITTGVNTGRYHCKIKVSVPINVDGVTQWKPRRAKTWVYVTAKEFKQMMSDRPGALQDKRDTLDELKQKAKTVVKIKGLTPDQYIRLMEGKGNFESVTGMFDFYINECQKEDPATGEARDGNASALLSAKRFFIRFKGSEHITFAEITKTWLDDCKAWALSEIKDKEGNVIKRRVGAVTFFIYCRALRTVMNLAVDPFGKISKDEVPFGKGRTKFKIPTSKKKRKVKLDLPLEELIAEKNKILNFTTDDPHCYAMMKHLNYWKASYFGNGANMADILRWRIGWFNREKMVIKFERKKTELTEEEPDEIIVFVTPELLEVINKEGNKSLDPEEYIFPVLKKNMTSAERRMATRTHISIMNRSLKVAAKLMGLQIKLSSGSARYLVSTLLDRSGIPRSFTKEIFGHSTESMQDHYSSPYFQDLIKSVNKILAG